ncbi:MAG: ribonuclease J [Malacoplasma sp.]
MSKIDFFSLGGLDEKDKACYVLEIDNSIYVFNMGICIPTDNKGGIRKIIPDLSWLIDNKNRIKCIFSGYPSKNNIGSLEYFYNDFKNIPIYSSELGVQIISSYFNKKNMNRIDENFNLNLFPMKPLERVKIGNIFVTAFRVSSSIAESLGFILHTDDGDIVYIDEFIFYNDKTTLFVNDYDKLFTLIQKDVLLLIVGVGNSSKFTGFTSPNHITRNFYLNAISKLNDSRLIVAIYDHDIHSFDTLATIATEKQIPIIIYNPIFFNVFSAMVNQKLLVANSLPLLPIQKINELKKGIVVLSASFDKLFVKLNSITKDEDEILKLKESDHFILGTRSISGFEKKEADVMDKFSIIDIDSVKLPKNFIDMRASSEDHKFLIKILKPKYIIPTLGLYYEMVKYEQVVAEMGFDTNNIFSLYNGEVLELVNGKRIKEHLPHIDTGDKFVGSQGLLMEGNNILMERKMMAENGIIFFSILSKNNNSESKDTCDWQDIGVFSNDLQNIEKRLQMKNETLSFYAKSIVDPNLVSDQKTLKQLIKKFIAKQVEKFCYKTPIVIVSII